MDSGTRSAVDWLLASDEPAVRLLARRDVLGEQVAMDPAHVLAGAKVTARWAGSAAMAGSGCIPTASGPGRTGGWSPWPSWESRPGSRARSLLPTRYLPGWSARVGAFA